LVRLVRAGKSAYDDTNARRLQAALAPAVPREVGFPAVLERVLAKLTYSNVMATVAVFLALGGGAYALSIPRDSVGARQIKRNAVRASEVKAGAVRSSEVKDASLLVDLSVSSDG
jgi:hypothetical protein